MAAFFYSKFRKIGNNNTVTVTRGTMKRKDLFFCFIAQFLLFFFCISPCFAVEEIGWYFKKNNTHTQPCLDEHLQFIRKYPCYYLDEKHSDNSDEKVIYLTFDAGYENGNVEKILDIMKNNDVKGTFFVLPRIVEHNTELCRRMKEEGHLVGNHSVHHKNMGMIGDIETFKKETVRLDEFFLEKTGYEMDKFFRPPEGAFSENTLKFASKLGYTTVFWSLAYADWDNNKQMTPEKALNLLLSRTHDGCVLLLHPTSQTNVQILDSYIKTMKDRGYEFCLVSELKKSTIG